MYERTWSRFTQTSFSCCVLQCKNWCSTLILCVSPLVALWPLPNLWLTLWRHSRFGEALSVTSSITTPAARLQVLPLSLAAAALSSFRLLLYVDVTLSSSCSTFLPILSSHPQTSLWLWLGFNCQTFKLISFLPVMHSTPRFTKTSFHIVSTFSSLLPRMEVSWGKACSCFRSYWVRMINRSSSHWDTHTVLKKSIKPPPSVSFIPLLSKINSNSSLTL